MANQVVKANTSFKCFLILGSSGRQQWLEIKEGTPGLLSDDGQRVVFEYGSDNAEAPIYFGDGICENNSYVHNELLERI